MALTKCIECGKPVSTRAANCPHCGAVLQGESPVRGGATKPPMVRPGLKKFLLWALAGLVGLSVINAMVSRPGKSSGSGAQVAREFGCDVRKADGSAPDRDCDLVELCKDAKYYNRKFEQAALSGNAAERESAGTQLKKLVVWMSAYKPEDVAAVCDGKGVVASQAQAVVPAAVPEASSAPAVMSFQNGTCSAAPLEVFPVGYAFTISELQLELARKCPGAALGPDGRIAVLWMGKGYTVETSGHREPNGLLIQQVRAVRAR